MALEAGIEMPFGLRFAASYGFVPGGYLNVITGALSSANAVSGDATRLVENGFDSGHTWRLQVGIRPFRNFGAYLDGGFSRITLTGTLDATATSAVAGITVPMNYDVNSQIDLWFLELGYQGEIADRVVLAGGFGLMRATNAETTARATGGSQVGQSYNDQATATVDHAIEKYGIIPTLNLRLGFDFI